MQDALLFVREEHDDQDSRQDDERGQDGYGGNHADVVDAVAPSAH